MLVLGVVIILFFVHSVPSIHLDLGWIAVLGTSLRSGICSFSASLNRCHLLAHRLWHP